MAATPDTRSGTEPVVVIAASDAALVLPLMHSLRRELPTLRLVLIKDDYPLRRLEQASVLVVVHRPPGFDALRFLRDVAVDEPARRVILVWNTPNHGGLEPATTALQAERVFSGLVRVDLVAEAVRELVMQFPRGTTRAPAA